MSGRRKRQLFGVSTETACTPRKVRKGIAPDRVRKLTDICAKYVAETFPYEHVDNSLQNIPEPIQERIVYWAFPQNENDIALYSSTNCSVNAANKQPFQQGIKLVESESVSDVLQIGFHLSGTVKEIHGICLQRKVCYYKSSFRFDRCKITSIACSCSNKTILWCPHAVALAVYRIRFADKIRIRLPVSESILQLKKSQLQSLLLHVITKHHDLLPSVQNLIDDFKRPDSEINLTVGVPDPTAGACTDVDSLWYFDDDLLRSEVKTGLEPNNTGKNISSLFAKVRELFTAKDENAIRLLSIITETYLDSIRPKSENEAVKITEKTRKLWDSLSSVWVVAVVNPYLTVRKRSEVREQLMAWCYEQENLPINQAEDLDRVGMENVFKLPLQAISWTNDDIEDNFICAAAFVDALSCHGCKEQALEIALRVAKNFKLNEGVPPFGFSNNEQLHSNGNWLGHSLDPISIFFDIFRNEADLRGQYDKFLPLAVYISFIGLSQTKYLPPNKYEQLRLCHREEQLIAQLEELDFSTSYLKPVLIDFCEKLCTQRTLHLGISPSHSFIRFLVSKLLPLDCDLAYTFSLPLLPLEPVIGTGSLRFEENEPVCHIMLHLQLQQSELAAALLKGCCSKTSCIDSVVSAIASHVKNPEQLHRLAKLANSLVAESQVIVNRDFEKKLLDASVVLGTKAVQLTLHTTSWARKDMIRWLISTTVAVGKSSLLKLLERWIELFTPEEVSKDVSAMLTSQPVLFKLRLDKDEEASYFSTLRNIVIESAIRDPPSCALYALTLCEGETEPFELACQIVSESANRLGSVHLFSIARYLDSKGHARKAFKAAMLAIKQLDITEEQETHPAISDVFWACALACSLGRDELTQITPIVCNCIRNPIVLTEIARRSSRSYNIISNGVTLPSSNKYSCNKEPLSRILATAQQLFVREVQNKLENISPKLYKDFVKYLEKVNLCFQLIDEGQDQFQWLLDYIAMTQKGRKKLQKLIRDTAVCKF